MHFSGVRFYNTGCFKVEVHVGVETTFCLYAEVLVSRAKADLTLQDANKNTALHLACSKVRNTQTSLTDPGRTLTLGWSFVLLCVHVYCHFLCRGMRLVPC